jgi:hypothetical protein
VTTAIETIKNWRLFQRSDYLVKPRQIILWWEIRRFPFNIIVGATGLLTALLLLGISVYSEHKFGETAGGSPFFAIMGVALYGIAANVCYTAG